MMRNLLFAVVVLCVIESIRCEGYYTVVGPRTIRGNSGYHVAVTSHGLPESVDIRVGVKGSDSDKVKNVDFFETVTVSPWETKLVEIPIGSIFEGEFKLYATGVSGIEFKNETRVDYNTKEHSLFMQTDKSVYKPGDLVRFRIIFLDGNLKTPTINSPITVYITDSGQNRIKQFSNITLNKGVFVSELQLSTDPVLGQWSIFIDVNGKTESKTFDVDEYVLPKFQVTVNTERYSTFKDGKITASIETKYTYGKPVKGEVTVTAYPTQWVGSLQPLERPFMNTRKTLPIDGRTVVEFNLNNDLKLDDEHERDIIIEAVVEEALTGRKYNSSGTVTIHKNKHKIDITGEHKYQTDYPYIAYAKVTYHDGTPVLDKTNKVHIRIESVKQYRYHWRDVYSDNDFDETQFVEERDLELDDNGQVKIKFNAPEGNYSRFHISAKYQDAKYDHFYINKQSSEEFLKVHVVTEEPKINKEVSVEVRSSKDLKSITYQVIGRGDILYSETIKVADKKTVSFQFVSSFSMVPTAKIHVYYISTSGQVISDSTDISFPSNFQNPLKIDLSKKEAQPGEDVDLTITTNPHSYVGLLGVDQSVMLLKSGNDLNRNDILNSLKSYDEQTFPWQRYGRRFKRQYYSHDFPAFSSAKTVVLTNANPKEYNYPQYNIHAFMRGGGVGLGSPVSFSAQNSPAQGAVYSAPPMMEDLAVRKASKPISVVVRKEFPETWIWADMTDIRSGSEEYYDSDTDSMVLQDVDERFIMAPSLHEPPKIAVTIRKEFPETWMFNEFNVDNDGTTTLKRKVPDSITSWIITGFSIDPITGFGMTEVPRKLNVFRPFFVSTDLPYSIKRGEAVSIPIVVFNYQNEDVNAEVILDNELQEFEFVELTNDVEQPKMELHRKKHVLIKANNGASVAFIIRPNKVGHIRIKVTSTTSNAGDGVERQLLVEPEGVTQYINNAFFVDLRETTTFTQTVELEVPRHAIPDSTKVSVAVIGDILGPTIKNLDKLIKQPYGCGEQNMLNFVPNIIILDYLAAVNQVTEAIKSKSEKYMEQGYQKELKYKHPDGSYSAFGASSDQKGSTWLTAFVAKSFRAASKYISIDDSVVKQALDWLSNVQAENGSFPEVGKVFHKDMQGGGSNGLALTSYVLTTFLQAPEDQIAYKNTIDKAITYILAELDDSDDIYAYAVAAYALQLAKHSSRDAVLEKLRAKAKDEGGLLRWEKPIPKSEGSNPWYSKPNSINVELTAYSLLAFYHADKVADAVPILRWLISQRNENGGFTSTQDTVVGIGALAKIGGKIASTAPSIHLDVKYDNEISTLNVNAENAIILQQRELPPTVRSVEIQASGQGVGLVQVSYKYNINSTGAYPRFTLNPKINENSNQDFLHLTVCAAYVPNTETGDLRSNMAVMEVSLPSGFTVDQESVPDLEKSQGVSKVETKNGDTVVILYFDFLDSKEICPVISGYRTHKVAHKKPVPILLYDYYDDTRRARVFYRPIASSLCDICEGADCGDKCAPETATN